MTDLAEEVREGSSLETLETASGDAQPQCAQRARIVALPSAASLAPVTVRVRQAGDLAAKTVALLDKPGTLAHSQPPTFRQAHDRHKDCADWFRTPVMKCLRRAWGWFHLLVILPPLYLLAWVTESPLRLLIAAALITAIWLFS